MSYAWGGKSEEIAGELEKALQDRGIAIVRDKTGGLNYRGQIREFMQRIGQGNSVIVIISHKYLCSENCMYEMLEIRKHGQFQQRIFPVVLNDARIYKAVERVQYLRHWEQEIDQLNEALRSLDSYADTSGLRETIDLYTDIRGAIAEITDTLGNMNSLTVEMHRASGFAELFAALNTQLSGASPGAPPVTTAPTGNGQRPTGRKQGKILYHIPPTMQVRQWTRCVVRIAFEELLLQEGLSVPLEQTTTETIRIGKVMQVAMEEGRNGRNFEIDIISEQEQIIFEDDYTEWLFDVKPLSVGTFRLVLKVVLIQIVEGYGERKKEVVLEREVQTVATPAAAPERGNPEQEETPPGGGSEHTFAEAGPLLQLSADGALKPASVSPQPQPMASQPAPERSGMTATKLKPAPKKRKEQHKETGSPQEPFSFGGSQSRSSWNLASILAAMLILLLLGYLFWTNW